MRRAVVALVLLVAAGAIVACATLGGRKPPEKRGYPDSFMPVLGRSRVVAIAATPDAERIAVATEKRLAIHKPPYGSEVAFLATGRFTDVVFSKDGTRVLAGSGEDRGTASIFDATTGQLVKELRVGVTGVRAVRFADDERIVLVLSSDSLAGVSVATGEELFHVPASRLFQVSRDGSRVLTREQWGGNTLHVLDARTGKSLLEVPPHFGSGGIDAAEWSPDESRIAIGRAADDLYVVDARTGKEVWRKPLEGTVALAFSPDGKLLAAGNSYALLRLHDAATGDIEREIKGPATPVHTFCFSADGTHLATAAWGRQWVRFQDPATSDFGPIDVFEDPKVRLYDPSTGREIAELTYTTFDAHHLRRTTKGFVWAEGESVATWELGQENRAPRPHSSGSFIR
ncbi:MAG: WD40 repeat domain-containing protein [Planctomycetota bacterium]